MSDSFYQKWVQNSSGQMINLSKDWIYNNISVAGVANPSTHVHYSPPSYTHGSGAAENLVLLDPTLKHMLNIVNHVEDYGQNDYQEEYDWAIIHDLLCPHKVISEQAFNQMLPSVRSEVLPGALPSEVMDGTRVVYECLMAQHLALHQGKLESLNTDWQELEEGSYEIGILTSPGYEPPRGDIKHAVLRLN